MSKKEFLSKSIQVRNTVISEPHRPYIIAEMACAHDGQLDKARKLVDVAVKAGADAVQFELFEPSDNIVPDTDMYKLLETLYFTPDEWNNLFEYTRQFDISVSAFAYDNVSLLRAIDMQANLIKLNSSDLSNPDMVAKLGETNIPCTVGTGSSTMLDIAETIELYLENGGDRMILMHGVQNFPTTIENANIRRINLLRSSFDCLVGYQDHTEGGTKMSNIVDLIALGLGASVIEKHITVDRAEKGIDYQAALEPKEFAEFVDTIHKGAIALGTPRIQTLKKEDYTYRQFQKKCIVAAKPIQVGTEITRDMLAFLRTQSRPGLSPMRYTDLIGKKASRDIAQYDQVHFIDVENQTI